MNQIVCSQSELFLVSVQIGVVIGIIFDAIRILRKSIKHPNFIVQIEDMIFWVLSGFTGFYMLYNCNYAEIRPYILLGILMGVVFYFLTFSMLITKVMIRIIEFVKTVLHKVYILIIKPIRVMVRYAMIPIKNIKKARAINKYNKKMRYREKLRRQYQLEADNMTEIYIKNSKI